MSGKFEKNAEEGATSAEAGLKAGGKGVAGAKHPHAGHRERVKQRFLKEGLRNFEEHQALELLLFYAMPQVDTNEKAHAMLAKYGNLSNLFAADAHELKKSLGISEHTAVLFKLIPQLSQKYMVSKWKGRPVMDNLHSAGTYCVSLYQGVVYETFTVLCLDAAKRLISSDIISEGTVDEAHVYPRKVVEIAIRFQANAIILVHNHPGGTMMPSFSDVEITKRIHGILRAIGIALSDHIIVCGDEYYSFAKNQLIDND